MTSFFIFFALIWNTATTGSFVIPVSESSDFLVYPLQNKKTIALRCDTEKPTSVKKWRERTEAEVVINAGFFDKKFIPVGFVKAENQLWGSPGNHPAVLVDSGDILRSKNIEGSFSWITSGFPILVWDKEVKFPKETEKYARRTIVGKKEEKLYIFSSARGKPSLYESAQALQKFGIEKALNLDGGTSTGFSSNFREIPSLPVPCVLQIQ